MARLTQQERALLKELGERAKAEDTEDAEYEVHVRNDAGHTISLKGARGRAFMAKHFPGIDDDDETEEGGQEAGEGEESDEPPAGGGGYFKSRK